MSDATPKPIIPGTPEYKAEQDRQRKQFQKEADERGALEPWQRQRCQGVAGGRCKEPAVGVCRNERSEWWVCANKEHHHGAAVTPGKVWFANAIAELEGEQRRDTERVEALQKFRVERQKRIDEAIAARKKKDGAKPKPTGEGDA